MKNDDGDVDDGDRWRCCFTDRTITIIKSADIAQNILIV